MRRAGITQHAHQGISIQVSVQYYHSESCAQNSARTDWSKQMTDGTFSKSEAEIAIVLEAIRTKQTTIKALEAEVNLLRDDVSDYVVDNGSYVSDKVKAAMTEATTVVSYDKNAINAILQAMEVAIDITQWNFTTGNINLAVRDVLIKYHELLTAARRESIRDGALRIIFK
jgi:hypothetical protein